MSRPLAASVAAALTAVGACAHHAAAPADPYVTTSVAAIRAWQAALPRCPPRKPDDETPAFRRDDFTDAIAVRGRLMLSGRPACEATACLGECCNTCSPQWVVVPDAGDAPVRELAVRRSGASQPLSAVIRECKVDPVREQLPPPRVSVSGFLDGDVVIRASICVIEEPPPAGAK